jgi:Protein of unknown function (DUF3150)
MSQIATIATSALLLELNVSMWTGRKRDKTTTAEVTQRAQASSSKAASVIKNLLSDDQDLDTIKAYVQDTRLYVQKHTFAWNDSGARLLPTGLVIDVTSELEARETEFNRLVHVFLQAYPTKISASAFKLGSLFNRNEYPSVDEIARKFKMGFRVYPVPTAGDFRVDIQAQTAEFLKEKFQQDAEARVADMMREPWERIYTQLTHVRERMEAALAFNPETSEGKAPRLFQSMIDNALELALLLEKMNVTNDPALSDCVARIRRLFAEVKISDVREDANVQADLKRKVNDILGAFDFGGFDE